MGHKRGPEVDDGVRGAIVALHGKARKPFSDISNLLDVAPSTAKDIYSKSIKKARLSLPEDATEAKVTTAAIKIVNVHSAPRSGAPEVLSERDKDRLIRRATLNKTQRLKTWTVIADECKLGAINRHTIHKAFEERGYGRYSPKRKPHLSEDMKETRYRRCQKWQSDRMDWKLVYWTDECPIKAGITSRRRQVTRTIDEEWHEDTVDPRFKDATGLMFWGGIAFDWKGPCYIFDREDKKERKETIVTLAEDATPEFERRMADYEIRLKTYLKLKKKKEDAKGREKALIKTGRKPTIPKLSDCGPMRSDKGGIDWFRYQNKVLPVLLPDWEEFQKKRSGALLMQDGAASHRSS